MGDTLKLLTEIDVNNKTVILRCDFNVSLKDGLISDDTRIKKSLKTINYLLDNNCKIIILSHFGRIKEERSKLKYSLKIIAQRLSNLINKNVFFINSCVGADVIKKVNEYSNGDIILLENTRFTDIPNKQESVNNLDLAKFWASLGDIYINDAFGASHREHSSVAAICKYLPSYIGFLVYDELNNLDIVRTKKCTVFMGGSKLETKLPVIKNILPKCDYLLLGGGILNCFLKAKGIDVKDSLVTNDKKLLFEIKDLLTSYQHKIILDVKYEFYDDKILDINVEGYEKYIMDSEIFFINGTPGMFEKEEFSNGTKELFKYLKKSKSKKIAGGGDTIAAINKYDAENYFDFISSGGGAALEYIAEGSLKALEWME